MSPRELAFGHKWRPPVDERKIYGELEELEELSERGRALRGLEIPGVFDPRHDELEHPSAENEPSSLPELHQLLLDVFLVFDHGDRKEESCRFGSRVTEQRESDETRGESQC